MQLELFFEKTEYENVSGKKTKNTYAYYNDDENRDWYIWCINKIYI